MMSGNGKVCRTPLQQLLACTSSNRQGAPRVLLLRSRAAEKKLQDLQRKRKALQGPRPGPRSKTRKAALLNCSFCGRNNSCLALSPEKLKLLKENVVTEEFLTGLGLEGGDWTKDACAMTWICGDCGQALEMVESFVKEMRKVKEQLDEVVMCLRAVYKEWMGRRAGAGTTGRKLGGRAKANFCTEDASHVRNVMDESDSCDSESQMDSFTATDFVDEEVSIKEEVNEWNAEEDCAEPDFFDIDPDGSSSEDWDEDNETSSDPIATPSNGSRLSRRAKTVAESVIKQVSDLNSDEEAEERPPTTTTSSLKCSLCGWAFGRKYHLDRHMRTVHKDKVTIVKENKRRVETYQCSLCFKEFSSAYLLKRHAYEDHPDEQSNDPSKDGTAEENGNGNEEGKTMEVECIVCHKMFSRLYHMKRHLKDVHKIPSSSKDVSPAKAFPCHLCSDAFPNLHLFTEHVKSSHMEGAGTGTAKVAEKPKQLPIPRESGRTRSHKCPECPEKFLSIRNVIRHVSENHDEANLKGIKCTMCDKVFYHSHRLSVHFRNKHKVTRFVCHQGCGVIVESMKEIMDHRTKDHAQYVPRPYSCNICRSTFAKESALKQHLEEHRNPDLKRSYMCQYCGRLYHHRRSLSTHVVAVHKRTKLFSCSVCGFVSVTKHNLQVHMEKHKSAEEKRTCSTCGAKFMNRAERLIHERSEHKGKQIYNCEFCGRVFGNLYSFGNHQRTHTQENKRFPCSHCAKEFCHLSTYSRHLESTACGEAEGLRHECSVCLKKFATHARLQTHKRKEHAIDESLPRVQIDTEIASPQTQEGETESQELIEESVVQSLEHLQDSLSAVS